MAKKSASDRQGQQDWDTHAAVSNLLTHTVELIFSVTLVEPRRRKPDRSHLRDVESDGLSSNVVWLLVSTVEVKVLDVAYPIRFWYP